MKVGRLNLVKCSKERFKKPDHLSTFLKEEEKRKQEALEEAIASVICVVCLGVLYFVWSHFS